MRRLLFLFLALPVLVTAADTNSEAACRTQLKRIGGAVKAYQLLHDKKIPARLSDLYLDGLLESYGDFTCPESGTSITTATEIEIKGDYTLEPLPEIKDLIIREKTPRHSSGSVLVMHADGSIKPAVVVTAKPAAPTNTSSPVAKVVTPQPPIALPPVAATPPIALPPEAAIETPPPVRGVPALPATLPPPQIGLPPAKSTSIDIAEAHTALSAGRVSEAREIYVAVTQADPGSTHAFIGIGRCANLLADLDGARAAYESVHRLAPATPNVRTWLAEVCLAKGDLKSAQKWIDAELQAQPDSAWAWSWLGSLQLEDGRQELAKRSMARAATLHLQISTNRYQNGTMLLDCNQPRRAAMDFIAAIMIDPRGTGAYYQLADCYLRLGQRKRAIEYFRRYLQGDSTSEWADRARQQIEHLVGTATTQP